MFDVESFVADGTVATSSIHPKRRSEVSSKVYMEKEYAITS
jgi:hypothetical protein